MGAHAFKPNKVTLFRSKTCEYPCFRPAAPKLALVPASRYNSDKGEDI